MSEYIEYIVREEDVGFGTVNKYKKEDIIRCENCKWWEKCFDGTCYGYCHAAKQDYSTKIWEIRIFRKTKFDFYCGCAERAKE